MPLDLTNLDTLFKQGNLAEKIDQETLDDIGSQVCLDFESDLNSRSEWETMYQDWMKLAIQVIEKRTYPWNDAANVKYPLLATSAMQFAARAYPTLVSGTKVVKCRVIGDDPDGMKQDRADRISEHMSYQLLEEMTNWDEDMDRACFILPIAGCVFKKIYFDPNIGHNVSELVLPKDLVVNYWAKTLADASTKTHVMYMSKNKIKEMQLGGTFLAVDLVSAVNKPSEMATQSRINEGLKEPASKTSAPLTILEQHRFWDLDDDDYEEPYIITVEYSTRKVLRITPRFEKDGVKTNGTKIIQITPEEYFLKFPFIPNPDGGFYDLGFGALLGPLNETVNSLINLLLDSGSMSNLQAGFISKGVRLKAGDTTFKPGEWKTVQTSGDDLHKGIYPLPTRDPSDVLFKLLGQVVESGQKLASVAEIFVGKMPGQNTPATTTMATIEQGMKVFTAIYKRIYRSLTKEFKRLYRLNKLYMPANEEYTVLDSLALKNIGQNDYQQDESDVRPAADPTNVSETLKLTKAQALMEMIPMGTVNPQEATKRILEAQEQPDIEKLMAVQPPGPTPDQQKAQSDIQVAQQKAQLDSQAAQQKMQHDQQTAMMKQKEMELKLIIEANQGKMDTATKQMEIQLKQAQDQMSMQQQAKQHMMDLVKAQDAMMVERASATQQLQAQGQKHQMDMQQMQEKHNAAMTQKDQLHQQDVKLKKKKITQLSDKEHMVEEVN
jgi:chaperonin GroES